MNTFPVRIPSPGFVDRSVAMGTTLGGHGINNRIAPAHQDYLIPLPGPGWPWGCGPAISRLSAICPSRGMNGGLAAVACSACRFPVWSDAQRELPARTDPLQAFAVETALSALLAVFALLLVRDGYRFLRPPPA